MIELLTGSFDSGIDLIETRTVADNKLKEELGFYIKRLTQISSENIVEFLLKNENFNPENLELFASFLMKLTDREDVDRVGFSEKALQVYLYIDKKNGYFFFRTKHQNKND